MSNLRAPRLLQFTTEHGDIFIKPDEIKGFETHRMQPTIVVLLVQDRKIALPNMTAAQMFAILNPQDTAATTAIKEG